VSIILPHSSFRAVPALIALLLLPLYARAQDGASFTGGYNDPGALIQAAPRIITWDGSNGVAINTLVGADAFYNQGIWGQSTVTANVEAGLVWNGNEITSGFQDYYTAPGAAGEFDMHATAVGSIIAGYNASADPNAYPYYQLGMAPLTQFSSGAIATDWYNATDPGTGQQNVYFDVTPKTFYSTYNHYFTTNWARTLNYGWFSVGFSAPTDVINSSWGFPDALATDPMTMAADGLARANPLTTLVVAAGNATTASNPCNNVGGPASGYNSISVGAVGNYTYNQFDSVADFSSRGPQDYYDPVHGVVPGVRAPVDLVAPGTSITAAYYGGQTGGNGASLATTVPDASNGASDWYALGLAGTSFAAPIVTGGVSLLKSASYYLYGDNARDTRVIKAVLMNSATKLPGWDNGQQTGSNGVVTTTQALDWSQGAGMLNLNRAFNEYVNGTAGLSGTAGGTIANTGWDLSSLTLSTAPGTVAHNDYTFQLALQAGSMLDVTLDWFRDLSDPVFTDNADPTLQSLDTTDEGLANLDLEIWNSDFTKLYAVSDSLYNNVQELHFELPDTGGYAVRVDYEGNVFGSGTAETYGLAWEVTDAIPEPSVAALIALAGCMVAARRRR